MIYVQKAKFKRSPSFHQKTMRFWTISLMVGGVLTFTAVFYFLTSYLGRLGH